MDDLLMFAITVRRGDESLSVTRLQQVLTEAGIDVGEVDGIFGAKTERGVKQFQEEHGLDADGVVGPLTREALEAFLQG